MKVGDCEFIRDEAKATGWAYRRGAVTIGALPLEAAMCEHHARVHAAVTAAIADLDGSHYVNEYGDMCAVCGAADGAWPCTARMVADDLRRAIGEGT